MSKLVRATVLVSIALLVMSSVAGPVTAADPTPIEDGGSAYQGYLLQTSTAVASGGATVGIYTDDGEFVRNVTANADGTVTWDTDTLFRGYQLTTNGSAVFNFSIRKNSLDATFNGVEVSNGGNQETATVTLKMYSTDTELAITSSDIPEFASRTDGATAKNGRLVATTDRSGEVQLAIDVTDLADGTYSVSAETTSQTTPTASVSFTLDSQTEQTAASNPGTERLIGGGSYWEPSTLLIEYPSDKSFTVRNADTGEDVFEGRTENGQYVFDTTSWAAGNYTISNASSGEEILTFEVREQTLNATVVNSSVNVSSNRAAYDLRVFVEELNRSELLDVIPAAEVTESGNVIVRNVSADTSLDVDTSNLSEGNYTVHVAANDTNAEAVVVVELQSSTSSTSSTSGSVDATTTTTTTPTATPTQTATATETVTDTATGTPTSDGGVSPSDAAGAGATAVGLGGAALLARRKYGG